MHVKTYRAKSMQEALAMVRNDLGPDAAVLHTRNVRAGGLLGWFPGMRCIEVTASCDFDIPSRLPPRPHGAVAGAARFAAQSFGKSLATNVTPAATPRPAPIDSDLDARRRFRDELKSQLGDLQSLVQDLHRRSDAAPRHDLPESLFRLFTDLIEADISEELARELVDRVRACASAGEIQDALLLKTRLERMIEADIAVSGPIRTVAGQRRVVALVGPTGVGKTTTIAKLAANFRLKEKRKVGLITVDTYRIAAVEQLRTYADIIDLPMEVVATPKEMRTAVERLRNLDLVLMDTAGRSPRDEVRIQELRSMLAEAHADEVHLVLSSVGSAASLARTAEKFAEVGATNLLLTKLDEATSLGNLLPLLQFSKLPLSYLTDGQNVPDDIRPADARRLARTMLNLD